MLLFSACAGNVVEYSAAEGDVFYEELELDDEERFLTLEEIEYIGWENLAPFSRFELVNGKWVLMDSHDGNLMEEFLSQFDDYIKFDDLAKRNDWERGGGWLAFISDVPLRNFSFLEFSHDTQPGGNYVYEVGVLDIVDILPAGVPVLASWRWRSMEPDRGISYIGEDGEVVRLAIVDQSAAGGDILPPFRLAELDIINAWYYEQRAIWDLQPLEVEFIMTPYGTLVDTRLTETEFYLIQRHFGAIEDGDAEAFQDTLGGGQDGVSLNYQRGLVFRYFPQWMLENDPIDFEGANIDDMEILHGTGIHVRKIDVIEAGVEWWGVLRSTRAVVVNDHGFEKTYILGTFVDEEHFLDGAIIGHSPGPDFSITWVAEKPVYDFVRRYDAGDMTQRPPVFTAYHSSSGDVIVVAWLEGPHQNRLYVLGRDDTAFELRYTGNSNEIRVYLQQWEPKWRIVPPR